MYIILYFMYYFIFYAHWQHWWKYVDRTRYCHECSKTANVKWAFEGSRLTMYVLATNTHTQDVWNYRLNVCGPYYEMREIANSKNFLFEVLVQNLTNMWEHLLLQLDCSIRNLIIVIIPISTGKNGILTLVIRGWSMRNIQDRYKLVYIFLIKKQKQNFLANVRLSVRPSVRKTSVH